MAARCALNAQDCNLGLQLRDGGLTAVPPSHGAFAFAWSGARGAVGICDGRYRFTVTVLQVMRMRIAASRSQAHMLVTDRSNAVICSNAQVSMSCTSKHCRIVH